jgi:hypothetical protein
MSRKSYKKSRKLNLESLESRELMAADIGLNVSTGTLIINGSDRPDVAVVQQVYDTVVVSTGDGYSTSQRAFSAGQVRRIAFVGRSGDDFFSNASNISSVAWGGAGNDRLVGGTGRDWLMGEAGVDFLFGQEGNDILSGGGDADYIEGGFGRDSLSGGSGDDVMLGGADVDRLYGQWGNDRLDGGAGYDYLYGQSGSDTLYDDRFGAYRNYGSGANYYANGHMLNSVANYQTGASTAEILARQEFYSALAAEHYYAPLANQLVNFYRSNPKLNDAYIWRRVGDPQLYQELNNWRPGQPLPSNLPGSYLFS